MSTPEMLALAELDERIVNAEHDASENHKLDPNCYGAGYDGGYLAALKEIREELRSASAGGRPDREAVARALWLSRGGVLRVWEELKHVERTDHRPGTVTIWECWRDADAILSLHPVGDEPKTLCGMIAKIYDGMDAEDRAWIDREWIQWRGSELANAPPVGPDTFSVGAVGQPISTAPRDGTRIIYSNGEKVDPILGYCQWSVFSDEGVECFWDYERDHEASAKYWWPLSALPLPGETPARPHNEAVRVQTRVAEDRSLSEIIDIDIAFFNGWSDRPTLSGKMVANILSTIKARANAHTPDASAGATAPIQAYKEGVRDGIMNAVGDLPPPSAGDGEPVAWIVEREGDITFPRLYPYKAPAKAMVDYVTCYPPATMRPLYTHPAPAEGLREALEDCEEVLSLVERPAIVDPVFGNEVRRLGETIGFGALMTSASASWRDILERDGLPSGGAFVAGPCHGTVIAVLKKVRAALSHPSTGEPG